MASASPPRARCGRVLVELLVAALLLGVVGSASLRVLEHAIRVQAAAWHADGAADDVRSAIAEADRTPCAGPMPVAPVVIGSRPVLAHRVDVIGASWRIATAWSGAFAPRAEGRFIDVLWGRPCE